MRYLILLIGYPLIVVAVIAVYAVGLAVGTWWVVTVLRYLGVL